MYEEKILPKRVVGLPVRAVKFYAGCLVLALEHVHSKGWLMIFWFGFESFCGEIFCGCRKREENVDDR